MSCFLTSVLFHNVGFSTVVCPRCAPEIGGTTQIWGHAKKFSCASRRSLCPQLQNRVGAYGAHSLMYVNAENFLTVNSSSQIRGHTYTLYN